MVYLLKMVSFDELDAIVLEDFSLCRKLEAETSIFFTLLWSDHGKIVMGEIEALRWCAIGGSRLGRSFLCEVNLKGTSCRIDQP